VGISFQMIALRPSSQRRTAPAARAIAILTAAAVACSSIPARAQDGGLPIIRDAEIEQLLRDYSAPVLGAAGLTKQNIHPVIISDRSFNAFVIDAKHIFVNAGALMDSKTPNQIIGVLAHETGHIAGGHLSKLRAELANAQTAAIIAMLLGVGAAVAGARSGAGGGVGNATMAAIMAPQSAMMYSILSYQRQQEEQADKAGVKFLTATGQSAKGMYETFQRFANDELYSSQGSNPYMRSHPMSKERVAALTEVGRSSPYWDKTDPPELQQRHDLMRAKLHGYLDRPDTLLRVYPPTDQSLPARYARAISAYRYGNVRAAVGQMDGLIQSMPNNPYFYELKGQALLESGHPTEAVGPLRHAVSLAPNPTLIQVMLGQALIATNSPAAAGEAIGYLQNAILRDPDIPDAYMQLAMAYGRKGDTAQADLASAQAAFSKGDFRTARQLAKRAKEHFPVGAPGWVKADDIEGYRPPGGSRGPF
jgi:predicted Zn-dependent protease